MVSSVAGVRRVRNSGSVERSHDVGARVVGATIADRHPRSVDELGDLVSRGAAEAARVLGGRAALSGTDAAGTMAPQGIQEVTNLVRVDVAVAKLAHDFDPAVDVARPKRRLQPLGELASGVERSELGGQRFSLFSLVVLAGDIQAEAEALAADAMRSVRDSGEGADLTVSLPAERTRARMRDRESASSWKLSAAGHSVIVRPCAGTFGFQIRPAGSGELGRE